jgi:two-component system sensor histidine kinase ChvG
VTLRRKGRIVEYVVEDSGPGIPPANLERIFERFYTDRPENSFGKNSGLGLSISRQIAEAHNGTIRASNHYGGQSGNNADAEIRGARFTVRLPVERSASDLPHRKS